MPTYYDILKAAATGAADNMTYKPYRRTARDKTWREITGARKRIQKLRQGNESRAGVKTVVKNDSVQSAGSGGEDRTESFEFLDQQIELFRSIFAAVLDDERIGQHSAFTGIDQTFGHRPEFPRQKSTIGRIPNNSHQFESLIEH